MKSPQPIPTSAPRTLAIRRTIQAARTNSGKINLRADFLALPPQSRIASQRVI
jgi:hypothetical protein